MVMCLGQGADLHMAQLMPLPLTISCSSKSRLVLPFWCQLTRVVPDKIQDLRNDQQQMHNSEFCLLFSCKFFHFNMSTLYFEKYRKCRIFFKKHEFTGQDKKTGNTGHARSSEILHLHFILAINAHKCI